MKLCIWPVWELHGKIRGAVVRVHLMPQEGLCMVALLSHRIVSRDLIADVLWPDVDKTPDWFHTIFAVRICFLRTALRRFDWTIRNVRRHGDIGWHLEEPFREMRMAA